MRGARSHLSGLSAEAAVAALYGRAGAVVLARRWRGKAGEIDLVLREGEVTVFVEVKSSRDHARAAQRLSPAQARRILRAAEEWLATRPAGAPAETRVDVALVDASGRIEIVENALSA